MTLDSAVVGLAQADDVRSIPREDWMRTSVQSIMRPLNRLHSVKPEMPVIKAIELMHREHINELPVISGGTLVGVFSRGQLIRFVQTISDVEGGFRNRAA